jgi:signal transduction histidine kinase/CheY-like chemotaxis protein
MLVDVLPDIDAILKALIVETDNREQDVVRALIVQRQLASRATARRYRLSLYITSLVLLVSLVILGLQLRKRALALRRQAAFEHVIADISMRFINSQHHELAARVEGALEQLAEFIGADRAYFVVAKHSSIYQWAREDVGIAKGWPELMMYRALRFDPSQDGIIRTARCKPDSLERELLEVAGLQSWLCVRSLGNRADTILGFDGVHARALGSRDDFALFRMAFDAIINAMDRVIHEQERERLEASLQHADRMETIGTFASGIAHNFNNIVAAILGYTEIADARIRAGKEPTGSLGEIRRAGERARELVDRILSFGSRSEGRRQPLSVKALISETQSLLSASLPPDISLSVIDASETMIVWGERAQLQQVILNVCNNATQAMDSLGTIDIQIEAHHITHSLQVGRKVLQPGRFTIISISDPGRGMDKATMERIFEPFFTTRSEGNGLGLATVRDIVEEHSGSIEVRSTLGVGTRFIIWLPSVWSQDLISVQRAGLSGSDFGRAVLVFDIDQEHLLRHEEIVAALGYEPLGFTDLTDAEQACGSRDTDFDAVLVCHQPGGAALSSAAALHAAAPNLPIILAVPSTRNLDSSLLAASGIAGIVRHPLTSSELSSALARCLAPSVARLSA